MLGAFWRCGPLHQACAQPTSAVVALLPGQSVCQPWGAGAMPGVPGTLLSEAQSFWFLLPEVQFLLMLFIWLVARGRGYGWAGAEGSGSRQLPACGWGGPKYQKDVTLRA